MDAALKRPVAPKETGILTNMQLAAAASGQHNAALAHAHGQLPPGALGLADPAALLALEMQMQSAAAYGLLDGFLDPNLDIFGNPNPFAAFGAMPPGGLGQLGMPMPMGLGMPPDAFLQQMAGLGGFTSFPGSSEGSNAVSVPMPMPIQGLMTVKQEDVGFSPPGETSLDEIMSSIQSMRNGESPYDGYSTESDRRDSMSGEPSPSEFGDNVQAAAVRRSAHIAAEQKRRNNIKEGFDQLQHMIPACKKAPSSKFSKATVLRKAVDYIAHMIREKSTLVEEVNRLRKEVCQLRLIIKNFQQYGQLTDADMKAIASAATGGGGSSVPVRTGGGTATQPPNPNFLAENVKFYIFCSVVDGLFESFNSTVSLDSPDAFSASLMAWFDQYCRPESLRESFLVSLRMLGSRFFTEDSINRVKRWSGGLSACTESLSCKLEYMNVPMVQKIGETITNVVTMFNGTGAGRRASQGQQGVADASQGQGQQQQQQQQQQQPQQQQQQSQSQSQSQQGNLGLGLGLGLGSGAIPLQMQQQIQQLHQHFQQQQQQQQQQHQQSLSAAQQQQAAAMAAAMAAGLH
eukprot:Opistho-2@90808